MIKVSIEVTVDGYTFGSDKELPTGYFKEPDIAKALVLLAQETEKVKQAMRGMQ
jgi:hypothetical protein